MGRPSFLRALRRAGVLEPKGALAFTRSIPWLLGRGASLGIVSQLNARAVGAKPAIHDRWGHLTWADLDRRVNRLAGALSGLGVGPDDRVAMVLRNGREIVETTLASQKLGAVACPLNTWSRPGELASLLETAAPRAVVYDGRHAEALAGVKPTEARLVVVVGTGPLPDRRELAGARRYEQILAEASPGPIGPFTRRRGHASVVIHTSGTTGRPKGASRGPQTLGGAAVAGLLDAVPFHRRDVILCPAPLFHSFGLLVLILGSLVGATFVFPDRFDPQEAVALADLHRASVWAMVPVMVRRTVARLRAGASVAPPRMLLTSGSDVPPDLRRAAAEALGPTLYDLYGSTEAGWVAVATPEDAATRPGTVGRPVPGVEVAVLSPAGEPLPQGSIGEVAVRSEGAFEGYTTGEPVPDRGGYLPLGDLGWLDVQGYLHVAGRADEVVVVGGENVSPAEVEAVIEDVPGVDEAAVLGIPDEEYGHALAAYVVGGADAETVLEGCRGRLASYKVPRRVVKLRGLPRTPTGKILRRELAEKE